MQWLKEHAVFSEFAKFGGFLVMVGVALYCPPVERGFILAGGVMLGIGYFWGKLVK